MRTQCATLSEVLHKHRASDQGITFISRHEETFISYSELFDKAQGILFTLQSRGMQPKDELVFQVDDNSSFIYVFWACILGGIIPVPISSGNNEEHKLKLARIWKILNKPYLVTSQETFQQIKKFSGHQEINSGMESMERNLIFLDCIEERLGKGIIHPIHPKDIALIQFSSGSTGDPKGVILTHENILCNINAITDGAVISPTDSALSWMPLTHDMGLIGFHLAPLTANISQFLMPPTLFILDPELWLRKAHEHRITVLSSPNFGYRHFLNHYKAEHVVDWDLSPLRLLFNGAEPISAELCERFLEVIEPSGARKSIMFPVYGMAEASLAVTFPPANEAVVPVHLDRSQVTVGERIHEIDPSEEACVTFVDVGYPVRDCEVRICDNNSCELDELFIGNIQIKGNNVSQGYYNNPIETNRLITRDGWLDTGDLGFLRKGRLVVTGRKKDIIFVRGQNYYPHDLESIVQNQLGIELGKIAICGVPSGKSAGDDIAVFVVYRGKVDQFTSMVLEIKRVLSKSAGLDIRHVIPVRSVPKTTSGKLQRYKLAENYERGEFTSLISQINKLLEERAHSVETDLPGNAVEQQLSQIWTNVLGLRKIGIHDDFFERGGDSLKAALLLNQIHKMFDIDIPATDLYELSTIKKLADYMQEAETSLYKPIPPAELREYYPLSSSQYRVYVQEQFEGIGTSYNMPVVLHLNGDLDLVKVEIAFRNLMAHHESMRTSFVEIEGEIVQVIHRAEQVDFSMQMLHKGDEDLQVIMDRFIRPFPMSEAPLFRVGIVTEGYIEQTDLRISHVVLDMHHTISDGISIYQLIEQFSKLYQGEDIGIPDLHYKDYVMWQQDQKNSAKYQSHQQYWQKQLSGELPLLEMPTDHRRSESRGFHGASVPFMIDDQSVKKLNDMSLKSMVSLNTILLTIYSILLNKYTRQQILIIGSLVSGRNHADLASVIGMFVNYIPLRVTIDSELTYQETLNQFGKVISEAYEHQDYPYEDMIGELSTRTPQGRNPLFDTMLILHNQMDIGAEKQVGDLKLTFEEWSTNTSKLDFKLDVYVEGRVLSCRLEYNRQIFRHETMERFCRHFLAIVQAVLNNPNSRLRDIEMLSGEERDQLLRVFNQEESPDTQSEIVLHEWFEKTAEHWPDRVAIKYGNEQLTYSELNVKADRLAFELRSNGLGPNRIAAIVAERSAEMMIGILAIMKAGGAYLPISPEYPLERISFMLEDSGAVLLLTQNRWLPMFAHSDEIDITNHVAFSGAILDLDDEGLYRSDRVNRVDPAHSSDKMTLVMDAVRSGDLAYVIYTSGSTGIPKGVMIEHRAVVNRIRWMQKQYPIGADDVILQKTAFTFDVSVWELFWWSFAGATVSFLVPGGEKDPEVIIQTIEAHQVTTLHFVPSMLHLFLEHLERRDEAVAGKASLMSLKYVFASGEALTPQQVERFYLSFSTIQSEAMLINLYGPTEAAIDVSYYDCRAEEPLESVPIGKPIDNIQLYVLNEAYQLQPVGIPGELYIAGMGLARGYIRLPELTAEKFVDNPYVPGTRMYRTGDLARWHADGTIVYMGRLDHQVKLRGYRIELGEIEAALLRHPDISEALVIVRATKDGDKYLSAYMVCYREITAAEIRKSLAPILPDYMIPSQYSLIERMPLTTSGKVDRKALVSLENSLLATTDYSQPSNELEARLAALWHTVLPLERIGVTDNFFEIGGHSLKATDLLHKIHKELQVNVSLKDIFNYPTVRQMASIIRDRDNSAFEAIKQVDESTSYALSPAQSRLFILQQFEAIGAAYHLPVALIYEGIVDPTRFEQALLSLIQRHESLRTSFTIEDGEPRQRIHADVPIAIEYSTAMEASIPELIRQFIRPFNLSEAPLMRTGIVQLSQDSQLILFDMHHLISDGVSMGILVADFAALYEGRELDQLTVQYKDFAAWQLQLLQSGALKEQEKYWLKQYADGVPTLNVLTDYNRPSLRSFEGDKVVFRLTEEETAKLKQLASDLQITLYMALLAVFNIFLSRYSGQEDIVVGTPVSGRSHADLLSTVGMFVNTLPMRNYPSGQKTFKAFVQELKDNTLTAFEHQDYPFEELVGKLKLTRSLSRNPLFDVMFVMQNMSIPELTLDYQSLKPCEFQHTSGKFDFTLEAVESGEGITCHFEYCTKLFKTETVEQWVRHYRHIVKEVTANPAIEIGEINMLPQEEITRFLTDTEALAVDYPREMTIHQRFAEQAERTPEHIAVICQNERMSYRELNETTNRLAMLLRSSGVVPDQRVGLMMDRSIDMIVGMLAILKAGGAYVPIDPEYPEDRALYMITDSEAHIVLTQSKYVSALELLASTVIDVQKLTWSSLPSEDLPTVNVPSDLAYIIYTSGTTGRPKGVMLEHRNVVRLLINDKPLFDFNDRDVWTMFHSYCFDFSVWEMYGALLFGGKLVVLEKPIVQDPERLLALLIREKVSIFNQTPSSFYHLIQYELERERAELQFRYVIFGGEALKPAMLKPWKSRYPDTKLVNMYGITETTVHVTYKEITSHEIESNISAIGDPIPTLNCYVLDRSLKLVPRGAAGELCVGGEGVARGYLNRPELTAEKFITNPYRSGETLYRSGDLVSLSVDGEMEYLGRIDHQVKIRGYRIELGEIENGLQQHPNIFEAVVLVKEGPLGDKELWAFAAVNQELTNGELRKHLSETLPDYMIPAFYVQLEKLPLTSNGKIDRTTLLQLEANRQTNAAYTAPQNESEQKLSEMWQEVLVLDRVGAHDNFFDIGGHSLLLLRLHALVEQQYPGIVKVTDLFAYPTIHTLAAFIEAETAQVTSKRTLRHTELPEAYFVVHPGQSQRSSFKYQMDSQISVILKRMALEVKGELDPIFTAVYLHLFAQITKKAEQSVLIISQDQRGCEISVNLSQYEDVLTLIRSVQREIDAARIDNRGCSAKDFIQSMQSITSSPANGIYPLFYKYSRSGASLNVDSATELTLSYYEENDQISLTCSFNERRLRKEKMKEFFQGYVKLLGWFTKQYRDSHQIAVTQEGAAHE